MADRTPSGGRRRAVTTQTRRPSALTVLALMIPLLTVAALALVRPAATPQATHAPTESGLDRNTTVCPAQLPGAGEVTFGNTGQAPGDLVVRVAGRDATVELDAGVATRIEPRPVVVTGQGDLASGLVATRAGGGSAIRCSTPAPQQWFTGLGAAAEHFSTLTLVNPDNGPAVADVIVRDASGVVDVPALQGVRVPGGKSVSFAMADVVPSRDALAVQVSVSRGRLGASVVDVIDPLGRAQVMREWLTSQSAPTELSYVVGLGTTPGDRVLTVANPNDSQVQVNLKLVSQDSEFAPSGLAELSLAPETVQEVDLSRFLRGKVAEGVHALRLEATAPITANLRTMTGGDRAGSKDLILASAGPQLTEAGVALPEGTKRIVVAGATDPGVVLVQAWDVNGDKVVSGRRVEIDPAVARRIPLPDDAVLALLMIKRAAATISVELVEGGVSVVSLDQLVTTSQLPDVRPAPR